MGDLDTDSAVMDSAAMDSAVMDSAAMDSVATGSAVMEDFITTFKHRCCLIPSFPYLMRTP